MARIICLANSRKLSHRCIAGIYPETGLWVRPVSTRPDRAITWAMRNVGRDEPRLLDLLEIPLGRPRPDEGMQPENRLLRDGKWEKVGEVAPEDVCQYCEAGGLLFHNADDCVPWDEVQRLPPAKRKSLQLVECHDARFWQTVSSRNKPQARVSFSYGHTRYDLAVTDALVEERILKGVSLGKRCLLTVSLAGKVSDAYPYCYKLAAGVIEL